MTTEEAKKRFELSEGSKTVLTLVSIVAFVIAIAAARDKNLNYWSKQKHSPGAVAEELQTNH